MSMFSQTILRNTRAEPPSVEATLGRQSICEIAVPRLGCGYDQLHWLTVFSILLKVFFRGHAQHLPFSAQSQALHATVAVESLFPLQSGFSVEKLSHKTGYITLLQL